MKVFLNKPYFLIALFSCTCLQLWSSHKGLGTTWDSVQYLTTAENISNGYGLLRENNQVYREWALGFPLILLVFRDSPLLNLLCLWGSLYVFSCLVETLFENRLVKYWLLLGFAFATPLYLVHHFVWTEPLFLCCLLACVWLLHQKKWFGAMLFGFLFMSLKNAGIYFLAGISSAIIVFYGVRYWKKIFVFGIVSISPFVVWFGLAKFSSVTTFRQTYHMAYRSLGEEIFNYSNVLSTWLVFPQLHIQLRITLLVVFLIAVMMFLFLQQKHQLILVIIWVSSIYSIGMVLTRAGMAVDAERFLALLYPFLLLIIGFVIDKIKIHTVTKYSIAFLWLLYPLVRTIKNIVFWTS